MAADGSVDAALIAEDRRRFFIITAARTGSTLLAAILADAGAEFGMDVPESWDREGGELEHPHLQRAFKFLRAAEHISAAGRPPFGLGRMRWNIDRSLGKRWLRQGLAEARFAKLHGTHALVRPAFKVGYFPTIILSHRRLEDQALSLGLMYAHADWEFLRENYLRVYTNGLWLLNMFGGCVVAYEEVMNPAATRWAEVLARVTGLSASRIVQARDGRVEPSSPPVEARWVDGASAPIAEALAALQGKIVPPSAQAVRQWRSSRNAAAEPRAPRDASVVHFPAKGLSEIRRGR